MEKVGIENLKEVLSFGISFQQSLGEAMEDGKVSFIEIVGMAPDLAKAPKAIQSAKFIPGEIADLDDTEKVSLYTFIQDKFDIEDDEVEEIIEDTSH